MGSSKFPQTYGAVTGVAEALLSKGFFGSTVSRDVNGVDVEMLVRLMERAVLLARAEGLLPEDVAAVRRSDSVQSSVTVENVPTCFAIMCKHMGVDVADHATSVSMLDAKDQEKLKSHSGCRVGYTMYTTDDPRNHVVPVVSTKSGTVDFTVDGGTGVDDRIHGVTSPQEFFNVGGRFFKTKFYAENEGELTNVEDLPRPAAQTSPGLTFGGDSIPRRQGAGLVRPPPPESVDGSDVPSGGANVTGGVVRPKKRVIKATAGFDRTSAQLRNYSVSGTTLFNNVGELFLNTISRDYAQEILEFVFQTWGVPTEEPEAMRYSEDIVFAFLIARTASNKADYNVVYDIPTRKGAVEADFSRLSVVLADHYGVTRRNFSRGIADDLRDYLRRPENQAIKSRAAARVGADPQYGHLCFDGSTECSNLTTSEQKFTRVLEAKGLYESDAVLADGASATLMEGIHGGTRSNVAR